MKTTTIMGLELIGWREGNTLNMVAAEDDGLRLAAIAAILRSQGWDAKVVAAGGIFNLEATMRA